ncbi:S-layer homology domain-containing protein [Paenibacillus sp. PL91]|uniref:S-layer homology domain-containing protein n=1 Tax=Paenibacillus sp. PL91 TaxID=2729538 RepID=UPI00145E6CB8|nr:S-layer homology domain-containing protein [Paenibacillus sp. PL91]MBC9202876.1 S-layer homology domain-containing protein [Paenibacillus sp. PL91]
MQNKKFKHSFLLLMTLLLALGNSFTVMAAQSLDVVSTSTQQDGTKNVVLKSTIDVEKEDFAYMMGGKSIEFTLVDAEGKKAAPAITKQIQENEVTISGSTYSIPFAGLEYTSLQPGKAYTLKAAFHSEVRPLNWEQSVNILPSSYSFKIERTAKGETASSVAVNDTIRSDDDKVIVTLLDEYGKPVADKPVNVGYHEISNVTLTTDADGQIALIGPGGIPATNLDPVLFLRVDQNTDSYTVGTVYMQDILDDRYPNYKVAELRFLDKDSKLFTQTNSRSTFNNNESNPVKFSTPSVAVYLTNGKIGNYQHIIKPQSNTDTYLYSLNNDDFTPALGEQRKTIILNAAEYSKQSFAYSWDNQPVAVESLSLINNSGFKQVYHQYDQPISNVDSLYVAKGQAFQFIAVLPLPNGDKAVVKNVLNTNQDTHTFSDNLLPNAFSALSVAADYKTTDNAASLRIAYLNDRYNYQEHFFNLAGDKQLYAEKDKQIYKLNAVINSNGDEAILDSYFTPTANSYSFKSGTTITALVTAGVDKQNVMDQRTDLILGETFKLNTLLKDDNGHTIDRKSEIKSLVLKNNETYLEYNYLNWHADIKDGKLNQAYSNEFRPTETGTYTIKMMQRNNQSNWNELSSTTITVAPKHEFDLEIRDQNGILVDLVNKPYLTSTQVEKLSITVREHVAGKVGAPVEGVSLYLHGQAHTSKSDANGLITLTQLYAGEHNEFTFSKAGYLDKTIDLMAIDPETQAIIRVSGLDKPESSSNVNVAGGVPMTNAYVYSTIQAGDTIQKQQDSIYGDETVSYLIVPSPSVVNVDFVRSGNLNSSNNGSPFGYYMLGNLKTEPGKDYNVVLDARQPLQQVSTVKLTKRMDEVTIARKDLTGADYLPYLIDDNEGEENRFYATKGTYNVVARTLEGNMIYLESVVLNQDVNTLDIPSDSSSLARVKVLGDATISSVDYISDQQTKLRAYVHHDDNFVNLTPGNVAISINGFDGSKQYQYDVHFTKDELKAGTQTNITTSALNGIDVFGLDHTGKIELPVNQRWIKVGLVNENGDEIQQYSTPELAIFHYGWSKWSKSILPDAAKLVVKNSSGVIVQDSTDAAYLPTWVYVEEDGVYTVTGSITIEGKTYTLDKTITVSTIGEKVTDPGTTPTPTPTPVPTTPPGTYPGTNPEVIPTPAPTPADADKGLQELLENGKTDKEKADKASDLMNSLLDSMKDVKDGKEAEKSVQNVSATLASASKLLESMQTAEEKAKVANTITQMVTNTKYAFEQVENGPKALELAKSIIKDTASVLQNLGSVDAAQIEALKDSLVELSKKAVEKAATVTLDSKDVKVEGNALTTTLDTKQIGQQLETTKKALDDTMKDLTGAVGADKATSIKPVITINIPKQGENITKLAADLPSEIYQAVQDSGLAGLKLTMGNTSFTVEPDTFGSVTGGQTISLAAEVVHNLTVTAPTSAAQVANIPVMEFHASVGGKKVEAFNKPMPVSFDVSNIDTTKYSEADLAGLTVYLLNEKTLTWEPVGGLYDPVTKTVNVNRGHFSKYTVMKASQSFKDIPAAHWAASAVNTLLNKGVLDQTAEFGPSKKVTREQFAAWLIRSYGLDGTGLSLPFKDVAKDNEYYDEIAAAYAQGLIQGKSATTFEPKAEITRQEIAALLSRALTAYNNKKLSSTSNEQLKGFKDASSIADWAKDGVALLKQQKLITGYEDSTYKPKQTTTKAEAAALIYRIYTGQ